MRKWFSHRGTALLSTSLLCLALFAGIAAIPLQAQAEDRELVVVGNGHEGLWELRIDQGPGGFAHVNCEGLSRPLTISAYRQDGTVRVALGVMPIDATEHSNPLPLGEFVIPNSGSVRTDAASPYGLPVLEFRLMTPPQKCSGDLSHAILPPSLQAEGFERDEANAGCDLIVRNLSKKRIVGYGSELQDPSGYAPQFHAILDFRPLDQERLRIGAFSAKPGQVPELGDQHFVVTYCLFEDGSYEGSVEKVKHTLITIAAQTSHLTRVVATLRSMPADGSEVDFWPIIRDEVRRLPDMDPDLEEKVIAKLAPRDDRQARSDFRQRLNSDKQVYALYLREYEEQHQPGGKRPNAHYWAQIRQHFESQLASYVKVLQPWLGDVQHDLGL